jgi:acyl carrier protein
MNKIEIEIRQVVAEITRLSPDISADANLYLDLGVASVHGMQLLAELEERFDLQIPDEEFVEATSITKLSLMVGTLVEQKGEGPAHA